MHIQRFQKFVVFNQLIFLLGTVNGHLNKKIIKCFTILSSLSWKTLNVTLDHKTNMGTLLVTAQNTLYGLKF